jgi:hypothetical protein
MTKRPTHAALERHNTRRAEAADALHRAEVAEREANSAVEVARDAVREAPDLGADASEAMSALAQSKRDAEQATLHREGVERRVRRAADERERFLEEHAEDLLAEMQPDFEQAAEALRTHAEALLAADRRWRELSALVSAYLRAQRLDPSANSFAEHGLEDTLRSFRRALQHEVASPGPHLLQAHAASAAQREHTASVRRARAAA